MMSIKKDRLGTDRLWHAGMILAWLPIATAAWAQEDGPPDAATMPAALAAAGVQIAIVDDTLTIGGTPRDDRILIKATRHPDTVRVIFNDLRLGHYGPIARIEVDAGDGDDVVLVGGAVELPARLNGGPGHDRLRGGAGPDLVFGDDGDDVLIATFGRDGLDGGPGSNRLVVRRPMGEIHVGPSAASDALRLLAMAYDLPPLETAPPPSATAPGPIIVGPDELQDDATVDLLSSSYQVGHTIALAGAEATEVELLRGLLGHATGGVWDPDIPQADLIAFRRAIRPDGRLHESTSILLPREEMERPRSEARRGRREADRLAVEWLSGVFSGTPVLADSAGACMNISPEQCLQKLANSYQSKIVRSSPIVQNTNMTVQIVNTVWGARSFQNQEDLYYVLQEVDYNGPVPLVGEDRRVWETTSTSTTEDLISGSGVPNPTVIQFSPSTTQETTEVTSSVSHTTSASVGFNETQGVDVSASASVTIEDSRETTVPPTIVDNVTDLPAGQPAWEKAITFTPTTDSTTVTFFNEWIWEIPFAAYPTDAVRLNFQTDVGLGPNQNVEDQFIVELTSLVPAPFGDTFAIQQPVVTSVDPTGVCAGDEFTITGTGLYPSLVQAVVIDGEQIPPANVTPVSDTEITVIAPDELGISLPVVVRTTQGPSNDTVTIEIDDLFCAPAGSTASEAVVPGPEG